MSITINNPKDVLIQSIEESCSLDKYVKTTKIPPDIPTDQEYQKNFNSYYRVRRDQGWLNEFYAFMQSNQGNSDLTFETVLKHLSKVKHKVSTKINKSGFAASIEVSFSSKLLATLNPKYPIWDSQVVKALDIKVPQHTIEAYVQAYNELCDSVWSFIETDTGKVCLQLFDSMFPHYIDINPVKKIDLYLWNIGKPSKS